MKGLSDFLYMRKYKDCRATDVSWWRDLTGCAPLEKGMANHFIFFLENPMNRMKRQNDRIPKDEFPRSIGAQYATGK